MLNFITQLIGSACILAAGYFWLCMTAAMVTVMPCIFADCIGLLMLAMAGMIAGCFLAEIIEERQFCARYPAYNRR